MDERFEVRHRELHRGHPNPGFAETEPQRVRRTEALRQFDHRTGPLVDEAISAAREMLKFGEHEGPCVLDAHTGKCTAHAKAFEERQRELADRLAALDEEAAR